MRIKHLSIPVHVKIMAPTRAGGIYLAGGPQFNIRLSEKEVTTASGFNFAAGFRFGGEINIGRNHLHTLTLETGYDWGFTEVVSDSIERNNEKHPLTAKTGSLTLLSLGFRFNLPKTK